MYDGTLAEDWRALITFQQMVILCDADGMIDMTPAAISRRTGIPIEHIKAGIEILENPDPYSRTEDESGCRISRIDAHRPWGWIVINHNKYKALQDAETVRLQTRERVRRHREEKRLVTEGNDQKRHTDTDTDTDKKKDSSKKSLKKGKKRKNELWLEGFDEFWKSYPQKRSRGQAEITWDKIRPSKDLLEKMKSTIKDLSKTEGWMKDKGKWIPYPSTWLNAKGWDDQAVVKIKSEKKDERPPILDQKPLSKEEQKKADKARKKATGIVNNLTN